MKVQVAVACGAVGSSRLRGEEARPVLLINISVIYSLPLLDLVFGERGSRGGGVAAARPRARPGLPCHMRAGELLLQLSKLSTPSSRRLQTRKGADMCRSFTVRKKVGCSTGGGREKRKMDCVSNRIASLIYEDC